MGLPGCFSEALLDPVMLLTVRPQGGAKETSASLVESCTAGKAKLSLLLLLLLQKQCADTLPLEIWMPTKPLSVMGACLRLFQGLRARAEWGWSWFRGIALQGPWRGLGPGLSACYPGNELDPTAPTTCLVSLHGCRNVLLSEWLLRIKGTKLRYVLCHHGAAIL